uniref:Uncharacterized protein n=1 Tax=Nelumbo nucifera TaxID=4432 RepID=A0A822YRU3_NELNU|nr:TPA_asm: hypothetical protein HUJ06_012616 [Nelumbo nucifera]
MWNFNQKSNSKYTPSRPNSDTCKVRHSEYLSDEDSEDGSGDRKRRCMEPSSCDLLVVVSGNSPTPMQADPVEYPLPQNAPTQHAALGHQAPTRNLHAVHHNVTWQEGPKSKLIAHYFTKTDGLGTINLLTGKNDVVDFFTGQVTPSECLLSGL